MPRFTTLLLLAVGVVAADGLLVHEPFAYQSGERLAGNAGGLGFASAWSDGHNRIAGESLRSKLGETPASSGGRMQISNPDWASHRVLATPVGGKPGVAYVSFLIANDSAETREHYLKLDLGSGESAVGVAKEWMSGTWSLVGPTTVPTQVGCATADAVFIVLKATWAAGAGAGKVEAFFDPELAAEPRIADAAMTGLDLPVFERVRLVGKKAGSIDELRIGTTWASVCPAR